MIVFDCPCFSSRGRSDADESHRIMLIMMRDSETDSKGYPSLDGTQRLISFTLTETCHVSDGRRARNRSMDTRRGSGVDQRWRVTTPASLDHDHAWTKRHMRVVVIALQAKQHTELDVSPSLPTIVSCSPRYIAALLSRCREGVEGPIGGSEHKGNDCLSYRRSQGLTPTRPEFTITGRSSKENRTHPPSQKF